MISYTVTLKSVDEEAAKLNPVLAAACKNIAEKRLEGEEFPSDVISGDSEEELIKSIIADYKNTHKTLDGVKITLSQA